MELLEIIDLFQSDVGTPDPFILTTETKTFVAFNGIKKNNQFDEIIVVEFIGSVKTIHGMPNNEALNGHPYYELGLTSHGFFILKDSDLIKNIAKINGVHPNHSDEYFKNLNHYILTFHDSMVECIAESFVICEDSELIKFVSDYFNLNLEL